MLHHRLGCLYQAQHKREKALKEFSKVMTIDPMFKNLNQRLYHEY